LERGLELGARQTPFDPLERSERALDGRTLPLRPEVRAEPGAQVASLADIEHLVVAVAEEVHARPLRRTECQVALPVDAAWPGGGQLDEILDRLRAALLGHADQAQEDLGGRLRVRERTVARACIRDESIGQGTEVGGLP